MIRRFEKAERVRVCGDGHGGLDIIEIIERLAHAHEHDVRDFALGVRDAVAVRGRGCTGPIANAVAGDEDLADDLGGCQVAHEPLRSGMAEGAGERAADLA